VKGEKKGLANQGRAYHHIDGTWIVQPLILAAADRRPNRSRRVQERRPHRALPLREDAKPRSIKSMSRLTDKSCGQVGRVGRVGRAGEVAR